MLLIYEGIETENSVAGQKKRGNVGWVMEKTIRYTERNDKSAILLILDKTGDVRKEKIKSHCLIGRKCEESKADVQVHSDLVSRKHGEIIQVKGNYYYKDLNSLNGTYINDTLFCKDNSMGDQSVQLKNGDVLRVDYGVGKAHHAEAVVMVFVTDYVEDATWRKQKLADEIEELNIGRARSDIRLDNAMVSQNHASFFRAKKGWAIIDHNSTNGVFLNGVRIQKPTYIYPMDVIRIANMYFFYDGKNILYPPEKSGDELVIRITEKSVWQKFKKLTLLQDTNLTVRAGEMVMILGGSGAGKTTFMNAVMGYEKAQGTILHGETNIYTEYEKMKYEIGYVPQQDLLRGSDTVYDTLNDAARMKLPKSIGKQERRARVEEVLEMVGLKEEAESQVSKISGGQRKRLSVAVEWIANPSLLFLDEADSGLDGPNSKALMENARAIADKGKIVMVITHAPDRVAELFDKVIVLAKSTKDNTGHLAFFGTIKEAYRFFDVESLESVVKRINRKDEGGGEGRADYYIEKYRKMCEK